MKSRWRSSCTLLPAVSKGTWKRVWETFPEIYHVTRVWVEFDLAETEIVDAVIVEVLNFVRCWVEYQGLATHVGALMRTGKK